MKRRASPATTVLIEPSGTNLNRLTVSAAHHRRAEDRNTVCQSGGMDTQ
jgi:hypothetical protein